MSTSQRAERHSKSELSVLSGKGETPSASSPPLAGAGGGDGGGRPNDAAWIEAYIDRAAEPIDFSPVQRRIRNRKLAAIEAETLNSERVATKIVAQTAHFIPLPPARDPWEDSIDEE